MKKIILALTIFTFLSSVLSAQFSSTDNYVTRVWNTSDGLSSNSISDIVQTQDGYLYFGTYESLIRFDGKDFTSLNKYNHPELTFISARTLFQDSKGNLWVGSNDEGVQKLSKSEQITYSTQNGLPNNSVRAITEDKQNNIWIGTASGIVYITPEGEIVSPGCAKDVNLSHITVSQLYCDSAYKIWLLDTEAKGIYQYTDNMFQKYLDLDESFSDYVVSSIAQDSMGNFWIGLGYDGIIKVKNGFISKVQSNTILDSVPTNTIYTDKSGALWFGTEKGLVLYKDGQFSTYEDKSILAKTSINKIFEDREGNIWVATDNEGIVKVNLGKFKMNILDTPVNAICEGMDGKVWIGTDEGLLCYKDDVKINHELCDFIGNVRVRHIETTSEGDILVSCYSSPSQILYTKDGIKNWTTDNGLAGNKTRVAIETRNHDIYVGTTTGLSVIHEDGSITNHTNATDMECEYVMCIYQDSKGDIWVGTDGGGIYILRNGEIISKLTSDDGMAGNVIFKITQDKKGNYWICTGSGVSKYDGKSFFNYNSSNGLGSDSIFQMLVDQTDTAWFVSNRGISSINYKDLIDLADGKVQFINSSYYTQNDGLKSSGANSTALSMIDHYGRIWLTLSDGFAIYDPLNSKKANVVPLITIESVKLDDTYVTDLKNPVTIAPGTKHIDIKYAGFSFTSSDRNRYTHKMEGFEDDYSELSDSLVVSYTNLKPGNYTFYVNIKNSEGLFAENPASVQFIQKPFFYQTYLFWIVVITLITTIIIVIFLVTKHQYKKRQLQLETKIQMATVELEMAKDDSDRLLRNILPNSISERMKGLGGEKTIADSYADVTVLFADIVNFTKTTSTESAEVIVESLNKLISRFDQRAARMGIEKIKTIGDAYMAACGVPEKNPKHSEQMLKFAIGMFKDLEEYNKTALIKFNIRIGLNSGPVIAGVIGQNKFIYDIWGDTVNVASRMESCCNPGHIRITEHVKNNIETKTVHLKCRMEEVDIKGKGLMKTYELPEK